MLSHITFPPSFMPLQSLGDSVTADREEGKAQCEKPFCWIGLGYTANEFGFSSPISPLGRGSEIVDGCGRRGIAG